MSSGKGNQPNKPRLAGIAEEDVSTAETDVPHPYFAGIRKLPVSWIMTPVIAFTKNTPQEGGKSK